MNEYRNIASYKQLHEAIKVNKRAMTAVKDAMLPHGISLLRSLSPSSLWGSFMRYVSPLLTLYDFFTKEKR